MSIVGINNVIIKQNPAPITAPFEFIITLEAVEELKESICCKVTFVNPATLEEPRDPDNPARDFELDSVTLGPVKRQKYVFEYAVFPPNYDLINPADLIGMHAVLITAHYREQEFVRVGYYVVHYIPNETEKKQDSTTVPRSEIFRRILTDQVRVTRFPIVWDHQVDEGAETHFLHPAPPPSDPETKSAVV